MREFMKVAKDLEVKEISKNHVRGFFCISLRKINIFREASMMVSRIKNYIIIPDIPVNTSHSSQYRNTGWTVIQNSQV